MTSGPFSCFWHSLTEEVDILERAKGMEDKILRVAISSGVELS